MTMKKLNQRIIENKNEHELQRYIQRSCRWKKIVVKNHDNNIIKSVSMVSPEHEQHHSVNYSALEMTNVNWQLPLHKLDIINGCIVEGFTAEMYMPRP